MSEAEAAIASAAPDVTAAGAAAAGDPVPRTPAVRGLRRHLLALRLVLNALLLLALLYTVTITRGLLIPLVLAAFIGLALNPIVATGTRLRLPRWLTASVLMIGLLAGIGAGVGYALIPKKPLEKTRERATTDLRQLEEHAA